jgi:hypothetical protein
MKTSEEGLEDTREYSENKPKERNRKQRKDKKTNRKHRKDRKPEDQHRQFNIYVGSSLTWKIEDQEVGALFEW